MELVKWNPDKDILNFHSRFGRFFDDFFSPARWGEELESLWNWNPVVDIYENDQNLVIKAELPGVDPKDISVDVRGRVLTLKGERSSDKEVKEKDYYRKERSCGSFERSFILPDETNPDHIRADYKDGVLKLEIPKPEEKKARQITIH